MHPRATLLILSYNQQEFLPAALAGAFGQDAEDIEILISDDNSTDDSQAVITRAVAAYKGPHRVNVNFNATNLGIVTHLGKAIRLAKASFVIVGAGDDVSMPNRSSRILRVLEQAKGSVSAVFSDAVAIDEQGKRLYDIRNAPLDASLTAAGLARDGGYINGATAGYAKKLIEDFGDLDPRAWAEDSILPFRAALIGQVVHIPEPLVLRRIHPRSMTGGDEFDRARMLRTTKPAEFAFRARLRDLEHPLVKARFSEAAINEMKMLVANSIERTLCAVAILERRPGWLAGWVRLVFSGKLDMRSAIRSLLVLRFPQVWRVYLKLKTL